MKMAIKDAERMRGELRFISQVLASDWDKVILTDEIYRLRRIPNPHRESSEKNGMVLVPKEVVDTCELLLDYRRRNGSNFQLEKADDYMRRLDAALDGMRDEAQN